MRRIALAALLLLALVGLHSGVASAATCSSADDFSATVAPLFPSCFEGADGNMVAQGPSPKAADWNTAVGQPGTIVVHDGTGQTDDVFKNGSKEEDPTSWSFVNQSVPGKDDVLFTARSLDRADGHVFLYLGSILRAANGSFDESYELNQLPPDSTGIPQRSTGDVLLTYDSNGGAVTVGLCTWKGNATAGQWLLLDGTALDATNQKACTQLNPQTTPEAEGAVNASAISAADNPLSGQNVDAGDFGEFAIDLSAALAPVLQADPCFNFGSIWMRTRSSNQVNSDPKDVVMPQPLVVGNCSLTIVKKTVPSTASQSFGFTAAGANAADLGGGSFALNGAGAGSSQTFNVHSGSYTVTEGATAGWVLTDVSCTGNQTSNGDVPNSAADITIAPGDDVTCTFTNTQPATVTVAKTEAGSSALTQSWQFQLTGPGVSQTLTATSSSASVQFDPVLPGTYQLCELGIPAGWYSSLGPADASGNVCAPVTLAAGEARQLDVDNVHPLIAIAKAGPASAPAGSEVAYTLTVTNPGNEGLPAPYVAVSDPLCEAPPALQSKNGDPTPDSLDPGDVWTYTCTVQTTAVQTSVHNTAHAAGQDPFGHPVSADASADTVLTSPPPVITPPAIAPHSAKLSGPASCVTSKFTVRVSGTGIARVVFYLDGKKVKTLRKPNSGKQFTLTLSPTQIAKGVRHVKAVVTYVAAAHAAPKTLKMTVQRCPPHVKPFFTG